MPRAKTPSWLCCWQGQPTRQLSVSPVPSTQPATPSPNGGLRRFFSAHLPEAEPPIGLTVRPEETALLAELRSHVRKLVDSMGITPPPGVINDHRLLRYVRHIRDPLDECERMLALRQAVGMDAIHRQVLEGGPFPADKEMGQVWEHNLFGRETRDKLKRPVFIARVGRLSHTRTLFARVSQDDVRAHMFHCLEHLNQRITRLSEEHGLLLSYTYVLDLTGLQLIEALAESRHFFKQLGEDVNRLAVPYQIAQVLLVNTPRMWYLVWEFAKLLLPEKVLHKVKVCSRPQDLGKYVDLADMPRSIGGEADDETVFVDNETFFEASPGSSPPLGQRSGSFFWVPRRGRWAGSQHG